MIRITPALGVAFFLLLAGCLSGSKVPSTSGVAPQASWTSLWASPTSLWEDPQNSPHPLWNWPTLVRPPSNNSTIPPFWEPVPEAPLPSKISGLEHVAQAGEGAQRGIGGIAVFGRVVVAPGFSAGQKTTVVSLEDPTKPVVLSEIDHTKQNVSATRGAAIIAYPDGRLVAVLSTSSVIVVYNITDPKNPTPLPPLKVNRSHKVGVVPGTPIVYNANSQGINQGTPQDPRGHTEIFDLTDPEHPVLVQDFKNGYGCHHIYFWITPEKQRALCAGLQMTQIWDIQDPRHPKVIVSIPMHHGNPALPSAAVVPVTFSHSALLSKDGTILVVGDEFMGGGPAECDGVRTPVGEVSGPLGNLWFYDVRDERNPKLLGWFSPPPHTLTDPRVPSLTSPTDALALAGCTAHHGRLVPDPEGKRNLLVWAWYGAGVVLVDFTDPTRPFLVDEWNPGTNTWEAWYVHGWIVTGDLARGIDVLRLR